MKKIQNLIVAFSLVLGMGASAALIVQENFTYTDAPVEGLSGGTGWGGTWDAGSTSGSTRRFNIISNEAIFNGAGTGDAYAYQNRSFASAISVGVADTVTLVFDLIRPEMQGGRGIGIYLTHGGANQFFVGKRVNGSVGLYSSMTTSGTEHAKFASSGTRETITMVITYNGVLTSMELSDSNETLVAYTFAGQLTFDGISLAGYNSSTLANGVDDISVDVVTASAVNGAMLWTGAGAGDESSTAANWLNTESGTAPTETPGGGLALIYTEGVVITNAVACNGSLLCGDNAVIVSNVAATMATGNLSGTALMIVTEAELSKGTATGLDISLNENAVLQLSDGANPLVGTTVELNTYTSSLKFDNETYADFASEHASKVTGFGIALMFGADPFVAEPGDNALATAFNGALGVEITTIPVDPNVPGALVWTDAGLWHGTQTLSNWLNTANGTIPTETPTDGGLELNYSGGVVITNAGTCNGDLFVGSNALIIDGVSSEMVNGSMNGTSTFDITDARLSKTYVSDAAVTLNDDAVLKLNGGGNPLDGATVDLNSATAVLRFNDETFAAFTNEHIAKVTSFGAALEFGSDPYVEEAGDNAVAADYNAPDGVSISYSDGVPPPPPLPAHEDFDGVLGESVNGTGSGNSWDGNWVRFGGTADATTFKPNNSFSDGTASVAASGLSAGLSGGEDLQRSLLSGVTVGSDTDEYPEVWLSFLLDSTAGNAIGHEYRVVLADEGADVVSFGKGVNKGWELKTSSTNLTFAASGATVGNFLAVVKLAFDGTDTVITGYLAKDSDAALDLTDVSTFLLTDSVTNSGNVVFDTVRIRANNTTATTVDEIRLADNYLDSIGLGGSPREPIGDIAFSGPLAGGLGLTWNTTFGQVYNVETNVNLVYPSWGVYETLVGNGGSVTVTTVVDQATFFYKVTTP